MLNACAGLTPNTSKRLFCLVLAHLSILCLPQGNSPAVGVFVFFVFSPPSTAEKKSSAAQDSRSYLQVRERHLKNNHPFSSVGYPPFPQGPLGTKGVEGWGGRTTLAHQEEVDLLKTVIPLPRLPPRQPPQARPCHLQRCRGSIPFPRVTLDALENLHRPHCFSGRACLPHSSPIWVPD